jgi:hypothetical protein
MAAWDERELLAAEIADAMGWEEFTPPDVTKPDDGAYRLADRGAGHRVRHVWFAPSCVTLSLRVLRAPVAIPARKPRGRRWVVTLPSAVDALLGDLDGSLTSGLDADISGPGNVVVHEARFECGIHSHFESVRPLGIGQRIRIFGHDRHGTPARRIVQGEATT